MRMPRSVEHGGLRKQTGISAGYHSNKSVSSVIRVDRRKYLSARIVVLVSQSHIDSAAWKLEVGLRIAGHHIVIQIVVHIVPHHIRFNGMRYFRRIQLIIPAGETIRTLRSRRITISTALRHLIFLGYPIPIPEAVRFRLRDPAAGVPATPGMR